MRARNVVVLLVIAAGVAAGAAFRLRSSKKSPLPASSAKRAPEEHCDQNGWCQPKPLLGPANDPEGEDLSSVWAAAPDDVHAVSLSGMYYHFDGVRWSGRGSGASILRHVHGVASNAVWMVGGRTALFWNGKELRSHAVPVDDDLQSVHVIARDDVWAVGGSGAAAHFDGKVWTRVQTPFRGWLLAVWGSKSDDVWAAGGGQDGSNSGHVIHWDGGGWTDVPLPRWTNIEALTGTARDDVWAAGSWGTLLHYDGARWTEVSSPAWRGLNGIWARTRSDTWAAGEDGTVLHFDGKAWTAAKPEWKWLRGVTGTQSGELFAVGIHGVVLHWQGARFRPLPALPPKPAPAPSEPTDASSATDGDEEALLGRARRLLAQGKIEAANQAFIDASGKDETLHLRPIVERAHMLMTRGAASGVSFTLDELAEQFTAGARDGDEELEAQAWYNLALLDAQRGFLEAERVDLARSLLRRDKASVRAKLGNRSACAAYVHTEEGPAVVSGWAGVCRRLGLCREDEAVTAKAARQRSCLTCSFAAGTPDESHGCEGDGPWESTFDYSMFALQKAWIAPVSGERFFVDVGRSGAWPAMCRGGAGVEWQTVGTFAVEKLSEEEVSTVPGRPVPLEGGVCLELPPSTTTAVFALTTAKPLGAVTVVNHHGITVTLDSKRSRLTLEGGACDGHYVPLDGTLRLLHE